MKFRVFALFALLPLTAFAMAARDDAKPDLAPFLPVEAKKGDGPKSVKAGDGTKFNLVDREQLRTNGRKFAKKRATFALPAAPAACNWTKGNTIDLPVLGNNQVGDCYLVYTLHQIQVWTGMRGIRTDFDERKVIARYRQLSGGDNGLSDDDIFGNNHNGEFYKGCLGPNGPNKILDHLLVVPSDREAVKLAIWRFGGCGYTCSLLNTWMNNIAPNVLWDANGTADRWAGHAMLLDGYTDGDVYSCETWGLNPPVRLTRAGMLKSDPELIVTFSKLWYDPETGKSPAGYHYSEDAALWKQMGGRDLPPWDGPAPTPPQPNPPTPPGPTPVPPAPGVGFTGTLTYANGVLVTVTPGGSTPTPAPSVGVEAELKGAGVSPEIIADVLALIADIKAKKGLAVIMADLLRIIADLK